MSKKKSAETKLCEIVNELGMPQVEMIIRTIKAYQQTGINFVAVKDIEPTTTIKIKTTESK